MVNISIDEKYIVVDRGTVLLSTFLLPFLFPLFRIFSYFFVALPRDFYIIFLLEFPFCELKKP